MSTNQSGGAAPQGEPSNRGKAREARPVSDAMLAIILVAIAAALVLGYLFLSKLVDISRQEDCMLAHNKNCASITLPDR
jgi:type VI protein secretion system component VasF